MLLSIPLFLTVGIVVVAGLSNLTWLAGGGARPRARADEPSAEPAPVRPRLLVPAATRSASPPAHERPSPTVAATTHGRLVLDGHFARRIGLLAALQAVPLAGKTVRHAPHEHLGTALVNVLAGHRQLQEISRGPTPLRADRTLAEAWDQREFADVSSVCRQLQAADWATAEAVRTQLRQVLAPYVAGCQARAQTHGERLVVDWDLMAKAITTDATSDPFAAYGHMEAGLGKGYQWAEATLRGMGPDGEPRAVALGGFLRPGNTHPPACVERLQAITEATLGRPRRRPALLAVRLAAAETRVQQRRQRVQAQQARVSTQARRVSLLASELAAVEQRLAARTPEQSALVARDERARTGRQRQLAQAQQRLATTQQRLAAAEAARAAAEQLTAALQARRQRLEADNVALDAAGQVATAIEVAMDAQFGGSEVIASLLEAGYEVTTKATSPATIAKLLRQEGQGVAVFGTWEPVSANAEVAECSPTRYAGCPYPLRLLGYRKHLAASASRPARTTAALVLTSVAATERSAVATIQRYHQRGGTVELLNRQAKSYLGWRGHRLRHGPGLDILGQFVFAGLNFIPWLADTLWAEQAEAAGERPGLAELTALAQAPADVLTDADGVVVQFRPNSGWPNRSWRLGTLRQLPLPGFVWPGVPVNAQMTLPNSDPDLVARKLG